VPEEFETKCRIDDTPAKMCGGRVLEIGGRDHVLIRGAGVASVLHTVRMAGITHAGASLIDVDDALEIPRGPVNKSALTTADREGVVGAPSRVLLAGVDFVGVSWSVRGVFEGVCCADADANPFVGDVVVTEEEARVGVPGREPVAERLVGRVLCVRIRSRNAYSFL